MKTSVYQLISDMGDPVGIHKQFQEGRFNFSKKGHRYSWPIWARQAKEKKTVSRGIFLSHCIAQHSTLNFITALHFSSFTKHRK